MSNLPSRSAPSGRRTTLPLLPEGSLPGGWRILVRESRRLVVVDILERGHPRLNREGEVGEADDGVVAIYLSFFVLLSLILRFAGLNPGRDEVAVRLPFIGGRNLATGAHSVFLPVHLGAATSLG